MKIMIGCLQIACVSNNDTEEDKMEYKIIPDQMTPKERMTAFANGEAIDRVPCCPFLGESFAPYFGHSIAKFNHNIDVIVDTAVRSFETFRSDSISIGPGLHGMPEAMGSVLRFPEFNTPAVIKPALGDYSDIGKLKLIDPMKDGRLNYYIEALKIVMDKIGHEANIGNTVGGPLTTAAFLIGTEKLMKDMNKRPDQVHKVLEIATENTIRFMDAIMDLGLTPGIAEPIGSSTMISPKKFREFAKPYITQCEDHIKKRTGAGGSIHICGKTKGIWGDMVDTGITALSLDNCEDIGDLKDQFGHKVAVVGNVDPVKVIMNGTREEIYDSVRECIRKAKDCPEGFILASGCDIPIGTDVEKIQMFMDAARIFGR